jgi:hypothetical protein
MPCTWRSSWWPGHGRDPAQREYCRDKFVTLSAERSARVLAGFQRVATAAQAIALSQGDRPVIRRFELAGGYGTGRSRARRMWRA